MLTAVLSTRGTTAKPAAKKRGTPLEPRMASHLLNCGKRSSAIDFVVIADRCFQPRSRQRGAETASYVITVVDAVTLPHRPTGSG